MIFKGERWLFIDLESNAQCLVLFGIATKLFKSSENICINFTQKIIFRS